MHDIPREIARQMFAAYVTLGGMFLLGLLLMVVLPIGINGCGGKLLIPWFLVVIPCLAWQETKDFDAFVLQPHWHPTSEFWIGLRHMGEFAVLLGINLAIFIGWGTLLEKIDKWHQRRAKA